MALELAKAWVTVGGDTSNLGADLNDAKSIVNQSMAEMAAGASLMFGFIASRGANALSQGLSAAGAFEKTTVEMETMIGSAQETQKTLADLTKFAVETPFEMPQLLQVTQGLIQFGERGDELMKTIKILGDASGGTNEKFQLLGMVFNQVRGVGKLLTQDFRQLATRGIISLKDISRYYKVTDTAAQEMLSNGKVSFNDFRKIMQRLTEGTERFSGMMAKTSLTLEGLKSTMSDAIGISLRMLATPLVPYVKGLYQGMIFLANGLAQVTTYGRETVSFAVVAAVGFSSLGAAIYGAGIALRFFGMTWKGVVLGAMRVAPWIAVAAAIGAVVGWIVSSKPVVAAFARIWEHISGISGDLALKFNLFYGVLSSKFGAVGAKVEQVMFNIGRIIEETVIAAIGWFTNGSGSWLISIRIFAENAIQYFSNFLDYVILFTTDISLSWEYAINLMTLYIYQFADGAVALFNYIYATVAATAVAIYTAVSGALFNIGETLLWLGAGFATEGLYLVSMMQDVAGNIVIAFQNSFLQISAYFTAFIKSLASAARGGEFGKQLTYQMEVAKNKIARGMLEYNEVGGSGKKDYERRKRENTLDTVDPLKQASEAYEKTFDANIGSDSPFRDEIKYLKDKTGSLMEEMKLQKAIDDAVAEANKPKKTDAEKAAAAMKKKLDPTAGFTLPQGRMGFAEAGNKAQDLLLNKNADHGAATVGLLEEGNKKTDELIKGVNNIPKPGLGK